MKSSIGRLVCLLAWSLAAVAQIVFVASVPDKIVITGLDVSHANHVALMHQALFIGTGLILAVMSYLWKKWATLFVIISSALYLAHWFPYHSVRQFGLLATYRAMFVIGSNEGLRLSFVIRDIVLPVAFIASIVFVLLEMRRSRTGIEN